MNTHLWKWILAICLLVLGTTFANAIIPSTFNYDGETQARIDYEASCNNPVSSYDGRAMLASNETDCQPVAARPFLRYFTQFLAAENAPLASVLEGHSATQGFTGVFDVSTGKVLIAPSTEEADIPAGWVERAGGHADVSATLGGDSANHSGFAVILQQDGTLNITWKSGTLNPAPEYIVPPNLQPTIIDAVQSATGKTINR